jgi:amidophosphoribosyltransferase
MQRMQGNMGIGHVRYPTAGSSSASEAQPFYVNSPYGITLAHNGNLTNAHELRKKLFEEKRRHINTTSDSEILLNIFASELDNLPLPAGSRQHFCGDRCHQPPDSRRLRLRGDDYRSRHGRLPRPERHPSAGAGQARYRRWPHRVYGGSESVALDTLGFEFLRDVAPGEAVYITEKGQLFTRQCADNPVSNPCLFEYVYFARPDSSSTKFPSTAPASIWARSWARKLPASGKIWISTWSFLSRKPPAISRWKLPVFSTNLIARVC